MKYRIREVEYESGKKVYWICRLTGFGVGGECWDNSFKCCVTYQDAKQWIDDNTVKSERFL